MGDDDVGAEARRVPVSFDMIGRVGWRLRIVRDPWTLYLYFADRWESCLKTLWCRSFSSHLLSPFPDGSFMIPALSSSK